MYITRIIPNLKHVHKVSGKAVSIYGAAPWTSNAEKDMWKVEKSGWTYELADGTVGARRPPAKTYNEAVEVANKINGFYRPLGYDKAPVFVLLEHYDE